MNPLWCTHLNSDSDLYSDSLYVLLSQICDMESVRTGPDSNLHMT